MVGVLLLTGWLLWDARRVAWEHAAQSSANVAATIENDINHTIELYDLSLQAVVDGLRLPGIGALDPAMRDEVLFDRAATARYLGAIRVLDETGQVVFSSPNAARPSGNLAAREFFRVHREHPNFGLYIGSPARSAATGAWSVALSRRLDHPDGSFAGVVVGGLRLDFFNQLFALVDTGPKGAIAVFGSDGILIDRTPYNDSLIGHELRDFALFRHYPQAKIGTFAATSRFDGVERLHAYRQIGNLPLVLTVGIARDTILAPWRQRAIEIAIAIFALLSVVGLLGITLAGELRRRGQAEQMATESERRYRLLAEHSGDMIVRFDPRSQRRSYVSPACRRLYGYEPDEALAMSAEAIIHPDDLPRVSEVLAGLEQRSHHPPIVYRGRRKDGDYIWVEASLTPSRNPETGAGEIVSVVRDIGERIRYEAALRQAKEEADAANLSKSQFLATMSHELRTPLNAIIGFAEIMQKEVMGPIGNEQYRSYIADINVSGSLLLQLINDILDLTKAEAGMLELNEDATDLAGAIRAVARASRASVEKAGLTLDIELPADLPPLCADERKVRQVFFNLIGNAAKFTPAGGRIRISGDFDPATGLSIAVSDTGIGVAPGDLDRVFEPFVQVDSSLARRHHGTGLGLPAVKAIMALHGGTIALASAVGAGSTVTVTFPPCRVVEIADPEPSRSAA